MSGRQRVFVVLKPDCLKRGLVSQLMSSIVGAGLSIERWEIVTLDDRSLEVIYGALLKEHFYKDLRSFMVSGPSMVLMASGPNAVEIMNELKRKIREENSESWIELTNEDIKLWEAGHHPSQTALNIKLVAANLIHVCDSENESIQCAKALFGT